MVSTTTVDYLDITALGLDCHMVPCPSAMMGRGRGINTGGWWESRRFCAWSLSFKVSILQQDTFRVQRDPNQQLLGKERGTFGSRVGF